MIRALVTAAHRYTFNPLLRKDFARRPFDFDVVSYESFLTQPRVPRATYLFCDLERLSPGELQIAAEAYGSLRAAGCRVVNDPARAAGRYELLRRLHEAGINDFEVFRADEERMPSQFPVFLRYDQRHDSPLSDLITTPEALRRALDELPERRIARRTVLIVGYRGEPFEPGIYRKYSSFRIGDAVFAHHIVNQNHWVAKHGDRGVQRPEYLYEFERAFVDENRHREILTRAFELGEIEYGRADFGFVGGRVQIYEINTNPALGGASAETPPIRSETLRSANQKLVDSLAALDHQGAGGRIALDLPAFMRMGRRSRLRYRLTRTLPRP